MPSDRTRELTLRLSPGPSTIAGTVADRSGNSRTFEGWLELAATLGAFLRGERHEREAERWRRQR
jgi:hypothetical protein